MTDVDLRPLTAVSLFTGTGMLDEGVRAALEIVGRRLVPLLYVESGFQACQILVSRFEEGSLESAPLWSDVRSADYSQLSGGVDAVIAGFPCQDVSIAGARAGLGEGTRSGLWSEVVRCVREVRPWLVYLENVRGLLLPIRNERGRVVGEPPIRTVLRDLAGLGFDAEHDVFSASEVGASHGRDRVFILAVRKGRGRGELRQPSRRDRQFDRRDGDLVTVGVCQADSLNRFIQEPWRGSEGRDGLGPASEILAESDSPRWPETGSGRTLDAGSESESRSGSQAAADTNNPRVNQVDSARDEREGPRREGGPRRGIRETGDDLDRTGVGQANSYQLNDDREWDTGQGRRGEPSDGLREVGNTDDAGLEGRRERGSGCGNERAARAAVDPMGSELANAERESISAEQRNDAREWPASSTADRPMSGIAGSKLGNASGDNEQRDTVAGSDREWLATGGSGGDMGRTGISSLFAPGPDNPIWQSVLVRQPWLRPSLSQAEAESALHGLADELADLVVHFRTDSLRACGNGCVPIQVAAAFIALAKRASLIS